MPCPHNEITIVQRSQRQSAVAAAAYQSGERLFCEYDQQVKHCPESVVSFTMKLRSRRAPPEYDRNTLERRQKLWRSNGTPACKEAGATIPERSPYRTPLWSGSSVNTICFSAHC